MCLPISVLIYIIPTYIFHFTSEEQSEENSKWSSIYLKFVLSIQKSMRLIFSCVDNRRYIKIFPKRALKYPNILKKICMKSSTRKRAWKIDRRKGKNVERVERENFPQNPPVASFSLLIVREFLL